MVSKGFENMLSALKSGQGVSDDEVRESISYDGFRNDLNSYLERARRSEDNGMPRIGFHVRDR